MSMDPRYTWEKLTDELRGLADDDGAALTPLCLAIHSVLEPDAEFEACFRQVQFLGFEVREAGADLEPAARWEALRGFTFENKKFVVAGARAAAEGDVLMRDVLRRRTGHPLLITFLILHFAEILDLPLALLRAKHHYLLKWVRPGKTVYLDMFDHGRALTDQQLITMVNRTASRLETCGARHLLTMYLELLAQTFERGDAAAKLHGTLDLMLLLDEMNVDALARRARLRLRLGMEREARSDLKRYFSFIEVNDAPADLRDAWRAGQAPPAPRGPTNVLH